MTLIELVEEYEGNRGGVPEDFNPRVICPDCASEVNVMNCEMVPDIMNDEDVPQCECGCELTNAEVIEE